MRISIFGMGYVGVVSGACLAKLGHDVIGVDVNADKVRSLNAGAAPIVEEGIAELVKDVVKAGKLRATDDPDAAVAQSDVSFVSVGTPSAPNGSLATEFVERVTDQIGRAIRAKSGTHYVVYRSTVLPGTTEDLLTPAIEAASGKRAGNGVEVCFNPEFLREGSSIRDFHNPPMTIVGAATDGMRRRMAEIYGAIQAPLVETGIRSAESIKYMSNIYHAVKICFANEMGALLKGVGIDAREVAEIFCRDTVLNVSAAYLRPGNAFGGSCLPKDLRAFLSLARDHDVELPMLSSILASNHRHVMRVYDMIAAGGRRRVALFGLAFKGGTDDLRESPLVTLAEMLIGKGFDIRIYDSHVHTARLTGSNKAYIEHEIPHLDRLLQPNPEDALDGAEVIVVGHVGRREAKLIAGLAPQAAIIDLQGVDEIASAHRGNYQGICW